jgi:hypothetical protein
MRCEINQECVDFEGIRKETLMICSRVSQESPAGGEERQEYIQPE